MNIDDYFQTGLRCHQSGNLSVAEQNYNQVLSHQPNHVQTLCLLGSLYAQQGRNGAAISFLRHALALNPGLAEAHNNLGIVLQTQGYLDAAVESYRSALACRPNNPEAYCNMGVALEARGELDAAADSYQKALALKPGHAQAHNNLGVVFQKKGRLDAATNSFRRALLIDPKLADAHSNMGVVHLARGRLDAAVSCFRKSIQLKPNFAEAHTNMGDALYQKGDVEGAVASYTLALAFRPESADARWKRSLAWLVTGNFERGWADYEWRNHVVGFEHRSFDKPRWDGSFLAGRTVLVHAEQGFGDTIQFVRYLPMVREQGGRVILECHPELTAMLSKSAICDMLVERRLCESPTVAHDVHIPLLSLPGLFRTSLANIPADIPYIQALPEQSAGWRDRFASVKEFKVGIAWAGNPEHRNDRNRSCNLSHFAGLAQIRGVTWFSLQKFAVDRSVLGERMEIVDLHDELHDFAETAGAIAEMDLVISVDTAVAHLSGALGRRTWTLLPCAPDWRWMLGRDDTPWYPTMRLFRQPRTGDWTSVFERVAAELSALVA